MSIFDNFLFSKKFLNDDTKEIFQHLPNALSDLISWKEMLSEVTTLSNRLITGKGAGTVKNDLRSVISSEIVFVETLSAKKLTPEYGEILLKIYFSQVMHSKLLFLDLRSKHFSLSDKSPEAVQWKPGNLWAELDEEFSIGIQMVYKGYYADDDVVFAEGLKKCQLVKSHWSEEQQHEVFEVFKKHFSNGREEKIHFSLEHFQKSFSAIFKTLIKNKIRLDKNFLYLGVMLVTLYMALDEIGGDYDVAKIFNEVA
ncbi:MAG: hypothetical protein H7281_16240 [Bacteriovorax sp.]|nr:hypothetical protein [Bacteriovorax sp.]